MAQVKAEYKRAHTLVQKALEASSRSERSLMNKMNSLSAGLTQLNTAHTTWVSRSDLSEEKLATEHVKYNAIWLETIWSEVDDLQDRVDKALELLQ